MNRYAGEKAETEPTVAARVASVTDAIDAVRHERSVDGTRIRRRRRPLNASRPPNRTRVDPGRVVSWADDVHDHDFPPRRFRARPPRARDPARPGRFDRLRSEEGGRRGDRRRQGDGSHRPTHRRCGGVDHHERHRGRPPRAAPLDVARARPGGDAAVPRRQVLDRPGDRERLLLRLRPAERPDVQRRRPRPDRGAHARDHAVEPAVHPLGDVDERGEGAVRRPDLQGRDHREGRGGGERRDRRARRREPRHRPRCRPTA